MEWGWTVSLAASSRVVRLAKECVPVRCIKAGHTLRLTAAVATLQGMAAHARLCGRQARSPTGEQAAVPAVDAGATRVNVAGGKVKQLAHSQPAAAAHAPPLQVPHMRALPLRCRLCRLLSGEAGLVELAAHGVLQRRFVSPASRQSLVCRYCQERPNCRRPAGFRP